MKNGDIDPIVGTMSTDPFAAFFGQHLYFEAAYHPITMSAGWFEQTRLEVLLPEEGGGKGFLLQGRFQESSASDIRHVRLQFLMPPLHGSLRDATMRADKLSGGEP
jgi:hypothetical protein